MQTVTLEVQERVSEKFMWLLSHFKKDEISVISNERLEFLKRMRTSENEINEGKTKPFDLKSLREKVS